jgi:hypothetical protein
MTAVVKADKSHRIDAFKTFKNHLIYILQLFVLHTFSFCRSLPSLSSRALTTTTLGFTQATSNNVFAEGSPR